MTLIHALVVMGSAFAGGVINSIAAGGTLLTFPALVWLGHAPITANATNTAALWPGSIGCILGYRKEMRNSQRYVYALVIPSILGGLTGAVLLRYTPPDVFAHLVPYLILFATLLFAMQNRFQGWLGRHESHHAVTARWILSACLFQYGVGIYGGYFGAGIGIFMLAALSTLGLTNIHQMNGLKHVYAMSINFCATLYFMAAGLVEWRIAVLMAFSAMAGGYCGAGLARRVGPPVVRAMVVAIGCGMAFSLLFFKN